MADTTSNANADANAGHKGNATPEVMTNQDNKAPADQTGYDPKAAKWDDVPGAAARANGYPRSS